MGRSWVVVLVVSIASAVAVADDRAADCAAASERMDATLRDEAHRVRIWRLSWGLAATAGAATQVGIALASDDRDARIDMTVGAISTLGLFLGVALPPAIDDSPHAEACPVRQLESERRLRRAAKNQQAARSPVFHAVNGLFNVAVGLVLGLGYGHWTAGAANAVVGFAVGEIQIFTTPNRASDALEMTITPGSSSTTVGLSMAF